MKDETAVATEAGSFRIEGRARRDEGCGLLSAGDN